MYEPVLAQLTRMSVELHGPVAVLRALARRERAPETIAAIWRIGGSRQACTFDPGAGGASP